MKKKQSEEPIITDGSKIQKSIVFEGKTYNLTLHMKLYTYSAFKFELIDFITNESGKKVEGVWHWGTYGNNHRQRLEFDTREGSELAFRTVASWCNGRKKNGKRQLVAIVEKSE